MTQIVYRANLSSASFPFVSKLQGRTVIIGGPDNNFVRQLQSSQDVDKDIGIPQIYYCHNVFPNENGFQAVGYDAQVVAYNGNDIGAVQEIILRDDLVAGGTKGYFTVASGGIYYYLDATLGYAGFITEYWDGAAYQPLPSNIRDLQLTVAHVSGISYLYVENLYCLVWNFTLNRFELTTLTGLSAPDIIGLTSSNGYLIAYSKNAVAWSSLIDPTDFVPSLQTGAGGGNVEGIKGNITCGNQTSQGFIIYTAVNAVTVLYTGNSTYPFQFQECLGAGGVSNLERVTYDADSGFNYAYTSYGFQIIKGKTADSVFAPITDYLAGQYFEDFDDTTDEFFYYLVAAPLKKKLVFIANRYLVISYGINELTHAVIYDTVQKRWGKLKFTHVDCFQYELLSEEVSDTPRKSIAFLKKDGSVTVANFSSANVNAYGTILLGKYQYVRSRHLYLDTASIENPTKYGTMTIKDFVSADGKNYSEKILGTTLYSADGVQEAGFGSPGGLNHSLLIQGAFNLTTIELSFHVGGRL